MSKNFYITNLTLSVIFVVLYGSGFVVTQLGLNFSEPLTFLSLRFLGSAVFLSIICELLKKPWPNHFMAWVHTSVSGLLLVGVFSIGVFLSIKQGTPAATSALIISLQPLIVAFLSVRILGEHVRLSQWLGLGIGLLGIAFILARKFELAAIEGIFLSLVGLLGLSLGNIYQKRFCADMNIFTGGVIHSTVAGILSFILALSLEEFVVDWQFEFIFSLLWMSCAVSIGALSVLYLLIQRTPISQTASLFYLIPVSTVILSAAIWHKSLDYIEIAGIFMTSAAVFLVSRPSDLRLW